MELFVTFIIALFATIALTPAFRYLAPWAGIMDHPDLRKVHHAPIPKTGGLSMAVGALIPVVVWLPHTPFTGAVLIGAGIIVVFGLKDDIRPMGPLGKLIPQAVAGLVVILLGGVRLRWAGDLLPGSGMIPDILSMPLTLVVILGITNAVNLADGLDGLAGGISILSFILIVFLALQHRNVTVAVMATAMVGGIAGFLRYNTHPAVLFMGDAGSQLLGFLSIVLALVLTQGNAPYSRALPLTLIGFPILDTLVVMVRRIKGGASPFVADKTHFHHRLMGIGFSHTQSVLLIYLGQSAFTIFALRFRFHSDWVHVLGFIGLSALIYTWVAGAEKNNWQFKGSRSMSGADGFASTWVLPIQLSYGVVKYGFPLVLACQVIMPRSLPSFVGLPALVIGLLVPVGSLTRLPGPRMRRIQEHLLRLALYLIIPMVIYVGEASCPSWRVPVIDRVDLFMFVGLVTACVLTMKLTRRTCRFHFTPLDILVCIILLILPNLPSMPLREPAAHAALAKSLVLFFCFELILRESRGETQGLIRSFTLILALLSLRGLILP